jgi:hypothetical protein
VYGARLAHDSLHREIQQIGRRLLLIVGLSIQGALVSALAVNPISFGLLGYEIGELFHFFG